MWYKYENFQTHESEIDSKRRTIIIVMKYGHEVSSGLSPVVMKKIGTF